MILTKEIVLISKSDLLTSAAIAGHAYSSKTRYS